MVLVCLILCNSRATMVVERRDVDREDGEHRHSDDGERDADNFANGRYGEYLRAYGGHIHRCPPKSIAKVLNASVYGRLIFVKYQCREVGAYRNGEDVGPE